jgi:hypothetical protein
MITARRFVVLGLMALTMMTASIGQALADQRWIDVYNNSRHDVFYIYMSVVGPDPWGYDLLGNDVLYSGYSYRVDPGPGSGRRCWMRMRVVFQSGRELVSNRFDACSATDATITNGRIRIR